MRGGREREQAGSHTGRKGLWAVPVAQRLEREANAGVAELHLSVCPACGRGEAVALLGRRRGVQMRSACIQRLGLPRRVSPGEPKRREEQLERNALRHIQGLAGGTRSRSVPSSGRPMGGQQLHGRPDEPLRGFLEHGSLRVVGGAGDHLDQQCKRHPQAALCALHVAWKRGTGARQAVDVAEDDGHLDARQRGQSIQEAGCRSPAGERHLLR